MIKKMLDYSHLPVEEDKFISCYDIFSSKIMDLLNHTMVTAGSSLQPYVWEERKTFECRGIRTRNRVSKHHEPTHYPIQHDISGYSGFLMTT